MGAGNISPQSASSSRSACACCALPRARHPQRLQPQLPQPQLPAPDAGLHRLSTIAIPALRRRPGPARPQRPQALRRPAQPRPRHPPPHPHALGSGPRLPRPPRLHVRLQLPADEPRRRPLVLAARHPDARRRQPHGRSSSTTTPRQRPLRSRLHRRELANVPLRPTPSRLQRPPSLAALDRVFQRHELTLQGGFVILYRDRQPIASLHVPRTPSGKSELRSIQPAEPPPTTN
jgi:hypothetical protein